MPNFAVLGATGSTGAEIVKHLLSGNDNARLYARSRERLNSKFPNLPARFTTHIGAIGDVKVMSECLRGVDTIFAVAATNHNNPATTISRDTSNSIINALENLSQEKNFKCPNVVFLSSLTLNKQTVKRGGFFHWLLYQSEYYVYEDVRLAVKLLREHPSLRIHVIEAQPGVLSNNKGGGYKVTDGTKLDQVDPQGSKITYEALAKAMVEIAGGTEDEYIISSARPEEVKVPWREIVTENLLPGLICSWARPIWHLGIKLGAWQP